MTMCKHGIGADYCALCNHSRLLPELEPVGFDTVRVFEQNARLQWGYYNKFKIRRMKDGRYTEKGI